MNTPAVAAAFATALPPDRIAANPASCAMMSADISAAASTPAACILRPQSQAEVVAVVEVARREGIPLHPRGGGFSYTGGYRPGAPHSALVDTAHLQGVAIDRDAATVTVGAGTRWVDMHAQLEAAGLRARSFGPLSGHGATIGGSAAQNGGFFGAAGHGAMGDGGICASTMVTGTGASQRFHLADRIDGPTAPQPLVGDCGAFGIRTDVTLAVMPTPAATQFASFNFPDGATALSVLAGLAGLPNLGEAYVFDPGTHANLARSGFSVIESAGLAGDLLAAKGGLFGRIGGLIRTARAGKAFVADLDWSLHLAFDGSAAEVQAVAHTVAARVAAAGGEVVPDVIPRVTRARPFRRIKALLGPDGEAWLPVHGVFAPDQAAGALQAVEQELAASAAIMQAHDVRAVILAVLMGTRVIIEPQLFWPDAIAPALRSMVLPEQLAAFGDRPANQAARDVALALRHRLIDALDAAGATHFQIGRAYAAHPGVPPAAQDGWRALKRRFDPDGIMNPGVLGL